MPQQLPDTEQLAENIRCWGNELGFEQVGFTNIDLEQAEARLAAWLQQEFQGEMSYMSVHGRKRSRPELLVPGTVSVISVPIISVDAPV